MANSYADEHKSHFDGMLRNFKRLVATLPKPNPNSDPKQ